VTPPGGLAPATADAVFVRSDHVQVRRDGESAVLADTSARSAFELDAVAASIAERLGVPATLGSVAERIGEEFDAGPEECNQAVESFVADLEQRGFVERYDAAAGDVAMRRRYLDLLARALGNLIYPEHQLRIEHLEQHGPGADRVARERMLRDIRYSDPETFASLIEHKREGRVWRGRPAWDAHTMVGLRRLENLEACAARIFADEVPGDFLEAGVCQGGAAIFLRALQVAYGEPERQTWVAYSFQGLPEPEHPVDVERELDFSEAVQPWLAMSLQAVQDNFRTYDLLSDAVRFVPGWFSDTLPGIEVEQIALLRLDADLYASTRDALLALYDRVSPGGYVVIDDYGAFEACRMAVDEFLAERGVEPELRPIDWSAVYWRKPA
jgi:O-methyltransferase